MREQADKEAEARRILERDFGKIAETEQPTPLGAQAPAVVLQETPAELEEEREGEYDEATLPREARGTTPINLDLARLHMTMPERCEVISPVPVITLPPLQEQVVAEEVPMAAPLIQEQVAPEKTAPGTATSEEVEMVKEEVHGEKSVPDVAMFMFGVSEQNLMPEDRARLEEQ